MGPTIICDKSILQMMAPGELNMLRRFYRLNVPPILCVEIMRDLAKGEDAAAARRTVQGLARKLVPICVMENTPFHHLIVGELSGYKVTMEGRAVLSGAKFVTTPDGKTGYKREASTTEKALLRWQNGEFHAADSLLAEMMRRHSSVVKLDEWQRKMRASYSPNLNLGSMKAVVEFVDSLMASATPYTLLGWFLNHYRFEPSAHVTVMMGLLSCDARHYRTAFPYTAFCLRAALIFHFALTFGLVSNKSNTPDDFEYLFYLPFCDIFSSGDKFHRVMAPHLLRENQVFVWMDELRGDFKQLCVWWDSLTTEQKQEEMERSGPPENEKSVTHRLWQKYMRPGYRDRQRPNLSDPSVHRSLSFSDIMKMVKSAMPSEGPLPESINDVDFVITEHDVHPEGPCFCGSGLTFEKCHGKYLNENL